MRLKRKPLPVVLFFMHKKSKNQDWLRPRGYVHFTANHKNSDAKLKKFLIGYSGNPETIAKHPFYPLIHRKLVVRRFKKVNDALDPEITKAHSYINLDGEKISNAKEREIFYSTHIDAVIYAYYTQKVLSPLYEKAVASVPGLSDCISAYRKIPANKGQRNKNNIHFAYDVFSFIKNYGSCTALAFDVSSFFDTLNHSYLKQQWKQLLGASTLPNDHFNIYKSLTDFKYVEFYTVLKEFGIKNAAKLRSKNLRSFCSSPEEFRDKIAEKKLIQEHPFKDSGGRRIGIPQGTPISAFLSNLYMFEFDQCCYKLSLGLNGYYRRYSDDIIFICPTAEVSRVKDYILNTITNNYKLKINTEKVKQTDFYYRDNELTTTSPLQYLGFEFNGKRTIIKPSSVSKFYRNMKQAVRSDARQAYHSKRKKGSKSKHSKIRKPSLYKRYSHLGGKSRNRNFIVYAMEASKIMEEPAIRKQISNAWDILNKEIEKNELKYKL